MLVRPALIVLVTFRSSWLMRSPNSVFGATSGTDSDASVMPGSTSPPTTHPCDAEFPGHEVYRVVGVISHTVPAPFGVFSCVADGWPVGPVGPPSRPESAPVPKPYPGRLWNEKPAWMPYTVGIDPAILNWLRNGMPLFV